MCKLVFLEMFASLPMTDISVDINNAILAFDDYKFVEFKYIMDNIKISYDAKVIGRY